MSRDRIAEPSYPKTNWAQGWLTAWNRFFFEPSTAHTLALIRIATGSMIAYIHLIWMSDLSAFMGPDALIDNDVWKTFHANNYKWTYLAETNSMSLLWTHELLALVFGILLCIGLATRITAPIAYLLSLMTVHRMTGFLFGLDQITLMLAMYLSIANSGDVWSCDALVGKRLASHANANAFLRFLRWCPSCCASSCWNNTVATRLIQIHLCVIYFFGGLGKMRGWMWWDGSAMWYSAAAYEYQSLDMTWIGYFPTAASIVTHIVLFWELTYIALVWPRCTRWLMLAIAVFAHGGIALFLGMVTFGWMMIVANAAFLAPELVQRVVRRVSGQATID